MAKVLRGALGESNVVEIPPKTVSEDFSEFNLAGIPSMLFYVGAMDPTKAEAARVSGTILPGLHSSLWAPDHEPTLKTAIKAETTALVNLLQ